MQAYGIEMVEKIKKSIEIIADSLAQLQDSFYIVGSSALVLAGIRLENIDDVDLLTSSRDADFLKQRWETYKLEDYSPAHADKFLSNFGRFKFNEVLVEVMGELKVFHENQWQILEIREWQEIEINDKISEYHHSMSNIVFSIYLAEKKTSKKQT